MTCVNVSHMSDARKADNGVLYFFFDVSITWWHYGKHCRWRWDWCGANMWANTSWNVFQCDTDVNMCLISIVSYWLTLQSLTLIQSTETVCLCHTQTLWQLTETVHTTVWHTVQFSTQSTLTKLVLFKQSLLFNVGVIYKLMALFMNHHWHIRYGLYNKSQTNDPHSS